MEKERITKRDVMNELPEASNVKQIGNNTFRVEFPDGSKAIRYHHTNVVQTKPNGDIVLTSGGWKTKTTKERINDSGMINGFRLSQDKGIWYIGGKVFQDGITITKKGKIKGAGNDPKKTLKLIKSANQYAKDFVDALLNGKIEKPSSGDCWYCSMKTVDGNIPLGDATKSPDHILSHIKEKYYVPSLLMNAIESFPVSMIAKSQIGFLLGYHAQDGGKWGNDLLKRDVLTSLRRYLKRQLNVAG